jgi:hypothetical protein
MKLSIARAIHRGAQNMPLIAVGEVTKDRFGCSADISILGDNMGYYLMGSADGTEWWVAHFVYGGSYAEGTTPKEAALAFAQKIKWLPEKVKQRKLAARIVAKYGIGPVITQEGPTWVARLDGVVVGKAANYNAAMKMGLRAESAVTE